MPPFATLQNLAKTWIPRRYDSEKQPATSQFLDGAYEGEPHYSDQVSGAYTNQRTGQPQLEGTSFMQQRLAQQQLAQQHLTQQHSNLPVMPMNAMQNTGTGTHYVKEEPMESVFPPPMNTADGNHFDAQGDAHLDMVLDPAGFQQASASSANVSGVYYRGLTPPRRNRMSAQTQAANMQPSAFDMGIPAFATSPFSANPFAPAIQQPQEVIPQHGFHADSQSLDDDQIQSSVEYDHDHRIEREDTIMSNNSFTSASEEPQPPIDAGQADFDDKNSEYQDSESEHDDEDEQSESDDDKPLKQRVQGSSSTQSGSKSPSVEVTVAKAVEKKGKTSSTAGAGAPAKKKIEKKVVVTEKAATKKTQPPKEAPEAPQPQPQPKENIIDLTTPVLNWKLPEVPSSPNPFSPLSPILESTNPPQFEFLYTPPATPSAYPTAKISLPGLVRHEILLSVDHHATEAHLFEHVFLPAQRTLHATSPDTAASLDPKLSVLNFHTIAGLCIDAFYNAAAPDAELGLGAIGGSSGTGLSGGKAGGGNSGRDKPLKPPSLTTLSTLDIDAVFFAASDNYRIGLLAHRDNYFAIRGVQEFCDVALDVCFFVKEHGFGSAGGKGVKDDGSERVRRERKDKGVKRGPRAGKTGGEKEGDMEWVGEEEGEGFAKPKGKGAKVNVVEARKKSKLKVKVGPKGKAQGKGKAAGNKVKGGKVEKKKK
ncbi:hypothetical protein K491DRAFT_721939 [Lophiostoma macrostomum CBS 122681]|uniref:Uncharacterized protein n=1 Tax=Lophiostoma macrostomum CBS 122681 TaxID=1314788 RepID=A0A6A6SNN9_9PLEO|nr:hypothetical protein K491DRAFT_721939 [Lophiostoma macrostomum CBS 122681]